MLLTTCYLLATTHYLLVTGYLLLITLLGTDFLWLFAVLLSKLRGNEGQVSCQYDVGSE